MILFALVSCSKRSAKAAQEIRDNDLPAAEDVAKWDDRSWRQDLVSKFTTNSYVHWYRHGRPDDIPDAGTFTGIALAVLDCEEGRQMLDTVLGNIRLNKGLLTRFEPKPEEDNLSSRDVVVGTMFGLAVRMRRCGDAEIIRDAWALHREYVLSMNGKLYPGAGPDKSMTDNLQYLWDTFARKLGIPAEGPGKGRFEAALSVTTASIREQKAACYPVHLQTLQALTAYALGDPISSAARLSFCTAANGMRLPLTEWYCERPWREFMDQPRTTKYQHQRCPTWETENQDGVAYHELDRILMKRLAGREIL